MAKQFLVTGGAGFIGSNYVSRLLQRGEQVTVLDNLSRAGARLNLEWLRQTYGDRSFKLVVGDVREARAVQDAAREADVIVHLAAQVAVTTSVTKPREDFEINALGTFNVLEAARLSGRNPAFLYASTNKVYGEMEDVAVIERDRALRLRESANGLLRNLNHSIFTRLTAARRVQATSTCVITTACMGCPPLFSASPAFMDSANSALKIRVGWPGL